MDIKSIFEELENTRSTKKKQEIISKYIDRDDFVEAFYLAYNPYINFFIKKLPDVKNNKSTMTFHDALKKLKPIYDKQITGKYNREEYITDLLSSLSERDAEILKRVIHKNLKCGCSRTTFNKVKNIIPKFSCLLAKDYDEDTKKTLSSPYYVQLKSDGSRACAIVTENKVEYRTREGNEYIMNVPHISDHLISLRNQLGMDIMVDGEVISIDENGICDRTKSNGIVNKAIVGTVSPEEEKNIRFYVWDCIHMETFYQGKDTTPYSERFKRLDFLSGLDLVSDGIEVIPTHIVHTLEEVERIGEQYILSGEEGAMVKSHDLVWEDKRSKQILKIKAENECELIVVGYKERDPNVVMNQGIGSLVFESSDKKLQVSVSGGLSYEMIGYNKINDEYVYDNTFDLDKYLGQIATITYNKRIPSKDGNGFTLFLPRIKAFRSDKKVADSLEQIKE